MGLRFLSFFTCITAILFVSCSDKEMHIADRHGQSYRPIADFCRANPGTTLVLFDYHHDCGLGPGHALHSDDPTSYDWVGTLVDRGMVSQVLWISGKTLLQPNRNARLAWLKRLTAKLSPSRQQYILDHVRLVDSEQIFSQVLPGPVTVSIDLDILTKDPGKDPPAFLADIVSWVKKQNPPLVTLALSAAYQPSPDEAWAWLEQFARLWPEGERTWVLDLDHQYPQPESVEEKAAWTRWSAMPGAWRPNQGSFRPGAGLWLGIPPSVRQELLKHHPKAGSEAAGEILKAWNDPDLAPLEALPQAKNLHKAAVTANQGIQQLWRGLMAPAPEAGDSDWGIAIRLMQQGHDRGCLALWKGCKNLEDSAFFAAQSAARDPRYSPVLESESDSITIQPALFGPWKPMDGPDDFVLGFHSVMIEHEGKHTLIQAPLALERNWSRRAFLEALAKKAGLDPAAWKKPGLKWFRCATLWGEAPLTKSR